MATQSTNIYAVQAREILDSRGNPTIETTVVLENGYYGISSIPSGASVGKYEAVELRDSDPKRYHGMGVLKAVNNVNSILGPKVRGKDALKQEEIDATLIALDGTPNKSNLGANSILSVSLASAVAASNASRMMVYRYLNQIFSTFCPTLLVKIPVPIFNIINGGKHGAGNLNFQEFQIIPASGKPYHDALMMGVEIYHALGKLLEYRGAVHSVGDEGGYAPNLFTNVEALELLLEASRTLGYRFGTDVFFGLDVASSYFKTDKGYLIKDRALPYSPSEFIEYFRTLNTKYRLLLLEDAFSEDDWSSWQALTAALGKDSLIIGDDLLVTNPEKLVKAINEKACSAILLKPNQIGTLSEFFRVVKIAKEHGFGTIVSHRSGETVDTFEADLAVAIQSDYVKFGAPARGERVAKYNRLLQIEAELSVKK
ncbi:phosphopyruvate hydratase [Candidatus Gottesmanbacteria bacterium]|nr:phosphopyruvate hydratase [Candidatus Gottesmanbacteria bacterium]